MYSQNDLKRVLRRNLESEFSVIKFYLENTKCLNYAKNRSKIDELIFDSFRHAKMISSLLLELDKDAKGKLDMKKREDALREESGVKELYQYELNKSCYKNAEKLFSKLIKEETEHEKIVRSLK